MNSFHFIDLHHFQTGQAIEYVPGGHVGGVKQ